MLVWGSENSYQCWARGTGGATPQSCHLTATERRTLPEPHRDKGNYKGETKVHPSLASQVTPQVKALSTSDIQES